MTRLIHLILYGEKITADKHFRQCFRTDLILKIASDRCFCAYFFTWLHQLFSTVILACFKGYGFGITEIVLSVYIVASVVVSLLSLLLLILLSLLFILVLLLLLLSSLYSYYLFFYLCFNVIVVVSILPIFIIKVEPCATCTFNDLLPCPTGVQSYMTLKAKFVQRNIVIL